MPVSANDGMLSPHWRKQWYAEHPLVQTMVCTRWCDGYFDEHLLTQKMVDVMLQLRDSTTLGANHAMVTLG